MESSVATPEVGPGPSPLTKHQFLIYRLFSLAGLIPIGAYVIVHLVTNATILDSPQTFQENVNKIHSLGVFLPVIEWAFIFLPLIFHATIGWIMISGMAPNTIAYPYARNRLYLWQRITGMIAFFFILAHVIQLHHLGHYLGGGQFVPEHASSSTAQALQAGLWIRIFYALGVLSIAYHLGNGLWTQGITWGLWISPQAQRRATYLSLIVGLFVAVTGLSALWGLSSVNVPAARHIEDNMIQFEEMRTGQINAPPKESSPGEPAGDQPGGAASK